MDHKERRGLVQSLLDDLAAQREVDTREALMELMHLVFELDDDLVALRERVSRLEAIANADE